MIESEYIFLKSSNHAALIILRKLPWRARLKRNERKSPSSAHRDRPINRWKRWEHRGGSAGPENTWWLKCHANCIGTAIRSGYGLRDFSTTLCEMHPGDGTLGNIDYSSSSIILFYTLRYCTVRFMRVRYDLGYQYINIILLYSYTIYIHRNAQ